MRIALFAAAALLPALCHGEEILVPRGAKSTWRYSDTGKLPDKAWAGTDFDAKAWKSGPAPFGYGEKGLGTTLSFGGDAKKKAITTWFRLEVKVADAAKVETLQLQVRRDDGAVIYWNGKEVARTNMPSGEITALTTAEQALRDADEATFHNFLLPAKGLVLTGRNVLAVEVHQCDEGSSDLIFDLEATAFAPGEKPKVSATAELKSAMSSGDRDRAYEWLLRLDPAEKDYAQWIVAGSQMFASRSGQPDDRYWTLLDKARAAAPDDMEIVYAWVRARVDARRDLAVKPAKRAVPDAVPEAFRFIADTPEGARARKLPRAALLADVDDLELIIENCYAYADRRGADWRGALDALRASIGEDLPREVFIHRVARMLTVFGDPHSRIGERDAGGLPVPALFVMDGEHPAALKPDRSGLLVAGHPHVAEINGRPVGEWLAAAEQIVPQASPQYRRHMALEQLSDLSTVARQPKLPALKFTLALTVADGSDRKEVELKPGPPALKSGGIWPVRKSEIRSDGIGYLRIEQMNSGVAFTGSLNEWMQKFKDTRGLIIDVRGNGGGTQDAIKTILPWLMKPGSPMKIINVAAYRLPVVLPTPNPSGFLGLHGRGLHPATSKVWTPAEAEQIRGFLAKWEPKWKLPAGKFSDWHVMAVSHETNPDAGYYDKPVMVLQNEECFSATDNFLGALKGHPGVTLMGVTSGGGSGRMADYTLPNSRLSLTLCQMASFATTGLTYDGNGVPPDVTLALKLSDHLEGGTDSVLAAAVARLPR